MYGNMDFWKYSGVCNTSEKNGIVHKKDPRYTSLEVYDKDGIRDGWKWAEETLNKIGV